MYTQIQSDICVHIFVYINIYTYIHIHIHIYYIHTHTQTHTHINIQSERERESLSESRLKTSALPCNLASLPVPFGKHVAPDPLFTLSSGDSGDTACGFRLSPD